MTRHYETPFALILLLWAAGLGAAGQFAKISVIFGQLAEHYPGTGATLGFLVSLISLMGILLGLYAGVITARTGFRRMLIGALILGAAMSFWQASLPAFEWMLVSRVIEGLSHLSIVVCAPTLIGTLTAPKHRPAAMTLWGSFFGVAFTVMGYFGLPFAINHGVPALFLGHGTYMLAAALALWFALPPEPRGTRPVEPLGWAHVWRQHRQIYLSPYRSAPALGWVFYTMTFVAAITLMPATVAPEAQHFVVSAMPLASMIVSLTIGLLLLRVMSAVHVVMLGFAMALVVTIASLAVPGSTWTPILLLATLGLIQGASFSAIPQLNHTMKDQALANGAMAQMGNLGNMIGTPLLLAMTGVLGSSGLTWFLSIAFVAGLSMHLLQAHRRSVTPLEAP